MIRLMRADDIPGCMRLKQTAGWNQTEQDWANVLALEPQGCWVYEAEGQIAGSTTAICYGQDLAWIGMVLVLPDFRGRGFARALMEHALAFLDQRRMRAVRLDATDMGRPLYEKLGFRDECAIERWGTAAAAASGPQPALTEVQKLSEIAALDQDVFGADRRNVLDRLMTGYPQTCLRAPEGYAMTRPGSNAQFLGPCVAKNATAASALIGSLLDRHRGQAFFWDLLPENREAQTIAEAMGFECRRRLIRMALGSEPDVAATRGHIGMQFATAGFEYG